MNPPLQDLPCVLLLDDEVRSLESMRRTLDEEYRILSARTADEARQMLAQNRVHVILCDQRMPEITGIEFLQEVRQNWPDCVRIIISGYSDSADIIKGVNEAGIYRYILKPWMPDHLKKVVLEAVQARDLQSDLLRIEQDLRSSPQVLQARRNQRLGEVKNLHAFERIVRSSGSPLNSVCEMARRIAQHDLSVLLQGESGTGKELLARAIHYASPRSAAPFVVENCAALTDTLLESELFGHKRGAFTGAVDDHIGIFQRADGGTLFLDEIGETSPAFQVKLLRALQEGEVRPVGSARAISVNVRVLCATHRKLEEEVRARRFREDLYYRLAEVTLTTPPLRERVADIQPIADAVLKDLSAALDKSTVHFSDATVSCLLTYQWPGNVRELRNEIARALAMCEEDLLEPQHFSSKVLQGQVFASREGKSGASATLPASGTLLERLDAIEAMVLRETMLRHRWNKTHAAKELGLSRVGLRAKLLRHLLENRNGDTGHDD